MDRLFISIYQLMFLIIASFNTISHLYGVPIILSISGRDSWLTTIGLLIFGLLAISVYTFLAYRFPEQSIIEISKEALGKILGGIIGMVYILFLLIPPSITLRGLMDFMTTMFYVNTPPIILGLLFLFICTYAVLVGLEGLSRTSGIILPILILVGVTISAMTWPNKDFRELLPVLENGLKPVIFGTIPLIAILGEIVVMCMIQPQVKTSSKL